MIRASGSVREIAVLHGVRSYVLGEKACDIFLDCDEEGLILENPADRPRKAEIYDRSGSVMIGTEEIAPQGLTLLKVPRMGMARVEE